MRNWDLKRLPILLKARSELSIRSICSPSPCPMCSWERSASFKRCLHITPKPVTFPKKPTLQSTDLVKCPHMASSESWRAAQWSNYCVRNRERREKSSRSHQLQGLVQRLLVYSLPGPSLQPCGVITYLSWCYRWGNHGTERSSNLPKLILKKCNLNPGDLALKSMLLLTMLIYIITGPHSQW